MADVSFLIRARNQASDELRKVGDDARKAFGGFGDDAERSAKRSHSAFGSIASSFGTIAASLGVGLGVAKFANDLVDVNTEFQRLNASLITVTGSQQAATSAFKMLEDFATKTPFQLTEVVTAFTKLKALGLDPSERALTSYGNTASAMGKNLNDMIEAVADAATGEFERLKEFGIKAKSQGDEVTFTFQGVSTTVKKEASAIEGYLMSLGETQFAGGMLNQMNTLGGAFSNLKDSYESMLRQIGDSGLNQVLIESIKRLTDVIKDPAFVKNLADFTTSVVQLVPVLVTAAGGIARAINDVMAAVRLGANFAAEVSLRGEALLSGNFSGAFGSTGFAGADTKTDYGDYYTQGGATYWSDGSLADSGTGFASMAGGSRFVPRTGMYQLHGGEEVKTRGESSQRPGNSVTIAPGAISITLPAGTPEANIRELGRLLIPELKRYGLRMA